jgi:hypothetical protein
MFVLAREKKEMGTNWAVTAAADLEREEKTRMSVARFSRAMCFAVTLLLLFNSNQLVTYVNGFGVGPVQDTAVALATAWNGQMEKNGMTRLAAAIRERVAALRNTGWEELREHPAGMQLREGAASGLRGMLAESRT